MAATQEYREVNERSATVCPACGATDLRAGASYCLTCGKLLSEDYQPLDSLRSSYRMQGRRISHADPTPEKTADLFSINRNSVSEVAWACFVYSLVPYLGILFVPFTIMIGSLGLGVYLRRPVLGGARLAGVSIGLSFVVFGVQVFLWWLLYIIPELAGRG